MRERTIEGERLWKRNRARLTEEETEGKQNDRDRGEEHGKETEEESQKGRE